MTERDVLALVDAGYAATRARLEGDPEWERLKAAADREAVETPARWFARNMLAIRLEVETPLPTRTELEGLKTFPTRR